MTLVSLMRSYVRRQKWLAQVNAGAVAMLMTGAMTGGTGGGSRQVSPDAMLMNMDVRP